MQRFSFVAVTSFLGRVLFVNGFSLSLVFVIGGRVVCQLNTKLSTHFFFVIFVSFGYCYYGWAFGLPKNFGSSISGIKNFGFSKLLPEIYMRKKNPTIRAPENSGSGSGIPELLENL